MQEMEKRREEDMKLMMGELKAMGETIGQVSHQPTKNIPGGIGESKEAQSTAQKLHEVFPAPPGFPP
jgi:chorismate synthase